MCARYARWLVEGDLEEFSDFRLPASPIPVTYNAAPQSMQPIIRLSPATGEPEIIMARWGLIPSWAKDEKIGFSTINARAEELETKPAFRDALKSKRCLVPANSFYEWQRLNSKDKQPYAIGLRSKRPFAFAGLWDRWKARNGSVIESFTVTTVSPNDLMTLLHDRMPCILEREAYSRWLEPGDPSRLPVDLLRPYPADKMVCWPIDKAVGNVRNDAADLIEEAASDNSRIGDQQALLF